MFIGNSKSIENVDVYDYWGDVGDSGRGNTGEPE